MKSQLFFLALSLVAASALADTPDRIVLPTDVVPSHYDLAITPDAAKMSFSGEVKIDLDVTTDTRDIKINSADLKFKKVSLSGVKGAPMVSFDTAQQTAMLSFKSPVKVGHHVLDIAYTGKINESTAGFFALDYETPKGLKRALFTQFENSDARRFLPSWDEPDIKTTFTLTATVPADEMAVSNMPVAKTTNLKGGLKRVVFQQTPKMSSYLLFFGLGDFERAHKMVDGIDVGIVVKRGDTANAQYGLDAAARILPYYNDYFGVKYPLPKLDLIAGPGTGWFGSMENWGAIFSFEHYQLIDPKISTQQDKLYVYVVFAHEMSHQWFGDLVTMDWWDDLWLNEGFATWMESMASDHFHPEWNMWMQVLSTFSLNKETAMGLDSRRGTHPIITPITDALQANEHFDTITYAKGASVIRMLEDYVGSDAFRDGVRMYMKDHAYGNTVTDQLWAELDKAAPAKSVTQVAHDFTLQAGVPLIRISGTPTGLHLVQDRYAEDETGMDPVVWHVPVTVGTVGGPVAWKGIVSRDAPVDVTLPSGAVPVVNAGQSGYYRSLYDAPTLAKITGDFANLAPIDQLGLLDDTSALGKSGYESMGDYMEFTSELKPGFDMTVLNATVGTLQNLNFTYEGLPGQAAFQAYGRKLLDPMLAKVGWDPVAGEPQNTTLLRNSLIAALGEFNDPGVVAEAQKRFAAYLKDPTSLSGDTLQNVLGVVAFQADAATWDQLHTLAKNAKSNLEKLKLYPLLSAAHDPAVAQRGLDLSLTDEPPATIRPTMVGIAALLHPLIALDFFTSHEANYDKVLDPNHRVSFVPRMLFAAVDPAVLPKLDAYAAAHIPANARLDVDKTEGAIKVRIKVRSDSLPTVDAWLASHSN